jgi:hypothetical protein
LIAIPVTFVLIFFWNWFLRIAAGILAWVSIVIVGVVLVALGVGLKFYAADTFRQFSDD